MTSVFFYGTLMHPKILKRVIGHDGSQLQIRPALLLDYTRHKVKHAEYPAIIPYSQSRTMFSSDLVPEERRVRGSVVTGLSNKDIRLLDIFEGDEYTWEQVLVYPLGPSASLDDLETAGVVPNVPLPPDALTRPKLEVYTYVWYYPLISDLEPAIWTLEEFVKEKAWKWVGSGSEDNENYADVDRERGTT